MSRTLLRAAAARGSSSPPRFAGPQPEAPTAAARTGRRTRARIRMVLPRPIVVVGFRGRGAAAGRARSAIPRSPRVDWSALPPAQHTPLAPRPGAAGSVPPCSDGSHFRARRGGKEQRNDGGIGGAPSARGSSSGRDRSAPWVELRPIRPTPVDLNGTVGTASREFVPRPATRRHPRGAARHDDPGRSPSAAQHRRNLSGRPSPVARSWAPPDTGGAHKGIRRPTSPDHLIARLHRPRD
jgi:hypothetical protein